MGTSMGNAIGKRIGLSVLLILSASAIGYVFRALGFPETNIVIVYLLAVLLITRFTKGYVFGVLASIAATFAFNYFFTVPYYSFLFYDPDYLITFFVMTTSSLITSTLTARVKLSASEAREKEAETKALYDLSSQLTDAENMEEIEAIAVKVVGDYFKCEAICKCCDENGVPSEVSVKGVVYEDWPIQGRESILGFIRMPRERAETMKEAEKNLLRPMIESIALAMERYRLAQQRLKSREEMVQERYRGNLLRAISHDLRTPLSGIIGTSEMIMDMTPKEEPCYALAEGIRKEAGWLHSLVENILNLTRLQDGKLMIEKEKEAAEEIVGGALTHISKHYPDYEITVSIPDELLLVPMDAKLIQQVLVNLMDNAIKHTPPENTIDVLVALDQEEENAVFCVRDRGNGMEDSQLAMIFQAFYTSRGKMADAKRGVGLGLTICDAIVKAHGGNIEARNRSDGPGAEFIFTLPMK